MDEFASIITLIDQDGNECEFELLDRVEYLDGEYVVLLPAEEGSDGAEVVILLVDNGDAGSSYRGIDDPATLNAVFDIFLKRQDELDSE